MNIVSEHPSQKESNRDFHALIQVASALLSNPEWVKMNNIYPETHALIAAKKVIDKAAKYVHDKWDTPAQ